MARNIDPITLEVIHNSLVAFAEEMATVLCRTAYNMMIYEVQDFVVGLIDTEGRLIAQNSGGLPIFLSDLGMAVKDGIDCHGLGWFKPGDVLIMNYPYVCGQHLNNIVIYTPAFYKGELVAFMAVRAHWVDVGGTRIGFGSTKTTEIFEEGLQFRAVKVYEEGRPNEGILQILQDNIRFPDSALGDMRAQMAACRLGETRFAELMDKYGHDVVQDCIATIWDKSEQLTRQEIAKIPDGEYIAESFMDNDGIELDKPVKIKVKVRVMGDQMSIDFSEMSDQVKGCINAGYSGGIAAARVALKDLTLPFLPVNEGCFRPLEVILPKGKLLYAVAPAAIGQWSITLPTVIDTIFKALAPALPHLIPAAHKGDMGGSAIHGINPDTGKRFVFMNIIGGGWGGKPWADGESAAVSVCQGDVKNIPVELQESYYPVVVENFSLREDSGGPGKYRGGLGLDMTVKVLSDCLINLNVERTKCPPWGIWGGHDGQSNVVYVKQDPAQPWQEVKKATNFPMKAGGQVRTLTAGGGGYGLPEERDPAAMRRDVLEGYVSREAVARDYKVLFSE